MDQEAQRSNLFCQMLPRIVVNGDHQHRLLNKRGRSNLRKSVSIADDGIPFSPILMQAYPNMTPAAYAHSTRHVDRNWPLKHPEQDCQGVATILTREPAVKSTSPISRSRQTGRSKQPEHCNHIDDNDYPLPEIKEAASSRNPAEDQSGPGQYITYIGQEPQSNKSPLDSENPQCEGRLGECADRQLTTDQDSGSSHQPNKVPKRLHHPHDRLWMNVLAAFSLLFPTITLVAIIFYYRVEVRPSAFADRKITEDAGIRRILVNIRVGRLAFVIQAIVFIAPYLSSYIMGLFAPTIARSIREASAETIPHRLPRPSSFSLIAAICQGAILEHLCYWISWQKPRISGLCGRGKATRLDLCSKRASRMHQFVLLVQFSTVISSSFLTLMITSANFYEIQRQQTIYEPGRGLSAVCINYDRMFNGYPCSYNISSPNYPNQVIEEYKLVHGVSDLSRLEWVTLPGVEPQNLAIVVPTFTSVPQNIDFRASTIGIQTQCSFITSSCDLHYETLDPTNSATYYTVFNCSEGFFGLLGKYPLYNLDTQSIAGDPDICPLCFKPSSSLTFAYFESPAMTQIYNSLGLDPKTDAGGNPKFPILPNNKLINPIYQAIASRIGFVGMMDNLTNNFEGFEDGHTYAELAMQCQITSYVAEYSRVQGQVVGVNSLTLTNGSILEIYHGVDGYSPTVDSGSDFLSILTQSSLQKTTLEFAATWERLMSFQVLGRIASTLTPRQSLLQQTGHTILVAVVPTWALVSTILCTLVYTALALRILCLKRGSSAEDRLLGEQMSTPGRVWEPFALPRRRSRTATDNLRVIANDSEHEGSELLVTDGLR